MTDLPLNELDAFLLTVTEAASLGNSGETLNGYRRLRGGMECAEQLREAGSPGRGAGGAGSPGARLLRRRIGSAGV